MDTAYDSWPVAAIQMVSSARLGENIERAQALVARAAAGGARLVLLPEYWALMGLKETDKLEVAESPGDGPIQRALQTMARTHQLWLVGGTLPLQSPEPGKVLNTTLVYSPAGDCVARYDKMHLFGFTRGTESYNEANTITPGNAVGYFDAPFGRVGLSVCYDLRFPELYRALGNCQLIVVPAAFTYTTGQAHWDVLLRARAIENQCYVLAAAQGGEHENGRRTWGHSVLVDPWGVVLDKLATGEGVVAGTLDPAVLQQVRRDLPALDHRRLP